MNEAIANLLLRVTSDTREGQRGLEKLMALLAAFGSSDAEAEAKISTLQARKNLQVLESELAAFAREHAEGKADLDTAGARAKLDLLEVALARFSHEDVSAKADVQIASALAKISTLRAAMSAFAHQGGGIDEGSIVKDMGQLSSIVGQIGNEFKKGETESKGFFSNLTEGLGASKTSIGPLSISLQNLVRAGDILVPIIGALAAGIIALGSSLGAAIGGLGALATAAVGAAGPILSLTVGAVARFTSASQALTTYRARMEAMREATLSQKKAEEALSTAQKAAQSAQDALARARNTAAQGIRDDVRTALEAQSTAEFNLSQAQVQEKDAQEALTQARLDAARQLVDLKSAAEGAALSETRARLNLIEAQRALKQLQAEGVGGLKEREARLAVAQAELDLKNAREQGKRSQQDLTTAEQKGVSGSDQVVNAKEALVQASHSVTDAQTALVDALRETSRAQRETVAKDQSVISAKAQVASANKAVRDSQIALTEAIREQDRAEKRLNKTRRLAAPLLSGAGLALRKAINNFRKLVEKQLGPAIDKIWLGVADSLTKNLGPLLKVLSGPLTKLGAVIGRSLRIITAALASKGGQTFLTQMTHAATRIMPLLTRSFISLARIFAHIAQAAMPFLIRGTKLLTGALDGLANGSDNVSVLGVAIGGLVSQLGSWLKLIGAVLNAFFQLGRAAAGPGQDFVDWLTQAIDGWAKWASTTQGQDSIRKFFDDMMPLLRQFVIAFVKLVNLGIKWAEIMAPAITTILKVLNPFLDLINKVASVLAGLPGPVRTVLGAFLLWKGPVGIVRALYGGLRGLIILIAGEGLTGAVAGFGGTLIGLAGRFGTLIRSVGLLSLGLRAIPYVAAGAAAIKYGDDLGKAVASLAGFSDEAIRANRQLGQAQGRLSNRFADISFVLRKIKSLKTREDFFQAFGKNPPWKKIEDVWAHHGDLASKGFMQKAITNFHEGQKHLEKIAKDVAKNVASIIGNISHLFEGKGHGIVKSIANGISTASHALIHGGKHAFQSLRDLLPGSEPKDKTSPLSRLDLAGKAIVENLGKGIIKAQNQAPNLLASKLASDLSGVRGNMGSVSHATTNHNQFDMRPVVTGGGFPDPDTYMAAISRNLRKRGLSLA
jgi:hypothetical protein